MATATKDAPTTDETTEAPAPSFAKGSIVVHTWDSPYDAEQQTRHGIVVDVVDATDDSPARYCVAWLSGVSGPIDGAELSGA
jgi:hypothetical protein